MAEATHEPRDLSVFGAVLALRPRESSVEALSRVVGPEVVVATHKAVSEAFGNAVNTVKQSWAPAGMPTADGGYPLLAILAWRLAYLEEQESRRVFSGLSGDQLKRQLAEEELRKLRANADRAEREEDTARGDLVSRTSVVAAWNKHIATLVERVMGSPDQIAQMLPVESAPAITDRIRGVLARSLTAYSETAPEDMGIEQSDLRDPGV